jgi:hypothetical protein
MGKAKYYNQKVNGIVFCLELGSSIAARPGGFAGITQLDKLSGRNFVTLLEQRHTFRTTWPAIISQL